MLVASETVQIKLRAIVIAIGVVAAGLAIHVLRAPPLDVLESSAQKSIAPGGYLKVRRTVEWLRTDCPRFTADAGIIDSLSPPYHHTVTIQRFGNIQRHRYFDTQWQIKYSMPLGEATFVNRLSFACFPFYEAWPIEFELPPITFQVSQ